MKTHFNRKSWFTFCLLTGMVAALLMTAMQARAATMRSSIHPYADNPPVLPPPQSGVTDVPAKPILEGGRPVELPPGADGPSGVDGKRLQPQDTYAQDGPTIDVWYGNVQRFGQNGEPVRWVNVVGEVSPVATLNRMDYKLNDGSYQRMDVGTGRRLWDPGDFNVEIAYADLQAGDNSILIRALDTSGNETLATVTVQYTPNQMWPLPYVADWRAATKIEDVAQVTDGFWRIEDDAVRTVQIAYDRTIAIGDMDWTNFEVTVPVTIHGLDADQDAWEYPSNGPGVGLLLRWQGHTSTGGQVANDWTNLGALDWFRWRKTGEVVTAGLERVGAGIEDNNVDVTPVIGATYMMKAQVKDSPACGGQGYYQFKVWLLGDPEPSGWNHAGCETTGEGHQPLTSGSFLLLAHHVDASFGPVTVTAPDMGRPTLLVSTSGNGQTATTPDWPDYTYDQSVTVTAIPDPGYVFVGWIGDIVSSANPLTFNITENTSLTANFAKSYPLDVTIVGEGAVTKTPDKAAYAPNEVVILTAQPDPGWRFDRWTGAVSGSAISTTTTINGPTTVSAIFAQAYYTLDTEIVDIEGVANDSAAVVTLSDPDNPSGYIYNELVIAQVEPAPGWTFVRWEGAATGDATPTQLTVTGDGTVRAVLKRNRYVLNAFTAGSGQGVIDGGGDDSYEHGVTVVLSAVPAQGSRFDRWEGDVPNGQNQQSTVSIFMDGDKTVIAVFVLAEDGENRIYLPVIRR